ncbi:unnamed protein product [Adineta steineri]|uniref:Uncharacterized protein n=1 Tax=Adineta steineri TaxID=433720 RepID=A0A816D1J3_9BILA|nr:unnamed protein product [Adineta steineri]CAF1628502.1 unnamed protein product [Adineta steineri]
MSFLLIFFILPYLCASSYPYGLIRNASIKISFDMNDDRGHILKSQDCNQCLCSAFSNPKVVLFTCTQNESINVTCQFYYFMPIRDEIQYPNVYTNIYLIDTNQTFEEKDDCCNTTELIIKINEALRTKDTATTESLRTLANSDNNTIITVEEKTGNLLKFDKSTFKSVDIPKISGLKAAGYYDEYYYLGTDKNIYVYNKNLSKLYQIPNIKGPINAIRFIDKTQEMIVGTAFNDINICRKDEVKGYLINCTLIPDIHSGKQLHAVGIVNENAFYVGWDGDGGHIHLYTRNPSNNIWTTNDNDIIGHKYKTSDIIVDNCKRIWAVVAGDDKGKVIIYNQDKTFLGEINVGGTTLFNLMIAENYKLIMSHGSTDGLTHTNSSLNCRPLLSNEFIQQKQRSNDLEDELQLIQKYSKSTQTRAAEQSQEIASLKSTKDGYDAQLAIFTNELLQTQDELKEKEQQITTLRNDLIPRSTTDDVDVLKRELITVQQYMNEMSLEKEQLIDKLRNILMENYHSVLKLERVETIFNQNLLIHDEVINEYTSQIGHEINAIKQFVRVTHKRQENVKNTVKYMRNRLLENQTEMKQLRQTNIQLQNDVQIEQRQINSYRNQIETLNNEIHLLKKNQVIQTKIGDDQDNDRQNFIRQIIQEKDQYEQQIKECRIQIKEINNQRQQIQDECDQMSKQILQITNEKSQLQNEQIRVINEMDLHKKQFDENHKDKEQKINELKYQISTLREQHISTENSLRIAKTFNNNQIY